MMKVEGEQKPDFSNLYRRYGHKVFLLAFRMTGNIADAEDITQETFLCAFRNQDGFRGDSRVTTWIYRIAKNLCYRHLEKRKRTRFHELETLLDYGKSEQMPQDLRNIERLLLINQIKEGCLTGLIRCLSFHQRLAFILNVLLGFSIKEVAEALEKSDGAVRVLVHRARKNLTRFLCRNCSLYNPENTCRCANMIGFSLKQGWIQRQSGLKQEKTVSMDVRIIEREIDEIQRLTMLYKTIQNPDPPKTLGRRIKQLAEKKTFSILNPRKV